MSCALCIQLVLKTAKVTHFIIKGSTVMKSMLCSHTSLEACNAAWNLFTTAANSLAKDEASAKEACQQIGCYTPPVKQPVVNPSMCRKLLDQPFEECFGVSCEVNSRDYFYFHHKPHYISDYPLK